jgi:hypothetical protein
LFDPYDIEVVAAGSGSGPNIVNAGFTQGTVGWSPYNGGSGSVFTSISADNGTFTAPTGSSGSFAVVSAGIQNVETGIQQSFSALSGQKLTFYVIFVSREGQGVYNDNGKIVIINPDGSLTLPIGVSIDSSVDPLYPKIIADSGKLFSVQGQGSTGSAALAWSVDPNADTKYAAVGVNQGGGDNLAKVVMTAGNTTATLKVWKLDENGAFTFPDNTVQTTAWTGIPGPYADDEAATLAGVALGSPYHKTGTNGQVFVRLTSPT